MNLGDFNHREGNQIADWISGMHCDDIINNNGERPLPSMRTKES